MKSFKDLQPGDFIYEIDPIVGTCNKTIIKKIVNKTIYFGAFSIEFNDNDKSFIKSSFTTYYSDKDACLKELHKLKGFVETITKNINKSIKELS